jgi:stage V sporulation protein G
VQTAPVRDYSPSSLLFGHVHNELPLRYGQRTAGVLAGLLVSMEITDIKIVPVNKDDLKAYAIVIVDHCLVIRDLKVIRGANGYFVGLPYRKQADATFFEIVSTINDETRKMLEERVLAEYQKVAGEPVKRRVKQQS